MLVRYSNERGLELLMMIDGDTFLEISPSSVIMYYHSKMQIDRDREIKFIKNRLGQFFAVKKRIISNKSCDYSHEFFNNESCLNWNDIKWKTNKTAQKAKELLESGNLDGAKDLYMKAITLCPHFFWKRCTYIH